MHDVVLETRRKRVKQKGKGVITQEEIFWGKEDIGRKDGWVGLCVNYFVNPRVLGVSKRLESFALSLL